jgi:hypothetical protein
VNEKTAQSTARLALGPVPASREGKYTFLQQENKVLYKRIFQGINRSFLKGGETGGKVV